MHHSALIYRQLMLGLWLAWVLYWVVWPRVPWDWLSLRLLPPGPLELALGIVLLALGLAFTVWARLLLALLGSAVACGELRAMIGLSVVAGAFIRKLRIEERFLRALFPGQYPRYCTEVPALIPFTKLPRSAPR